MAADVAQCCGSQQGVANRVEQDVAVRVGSQTPFEGNLHPA
jgi:hypothetical protein